MRLTPDQWPKIKAYDADHERRRKEQLNKLFSRTPEQVRKQYNVARCCESLLLFRVQVEEEENLLNEQKKIEQRKKEREKKTQDLQKLISAAESNIVDAARKNERKQTKKKQQQQQKQTEKNVSASLRFFILQGNKLN